MGAAALGFVRDRDLLFSEYFGRFQLEKWKSGAQGDLGGKLDNGGIHFEIVTVTSASYDLLTSVC